MIRLKMLFPSSCGHQISLLCYVIRSLQSKPAVIYYLVNQADRAAYSYIPVALFYCGDYEYLLNSCLH